MSLSYSSRIYLSHIMQRCPRPYTQRFYVCCAAIPRLNLPDVFFSEVVDGPTSRGRRRERDVSNSSLRRRDRRPSPRRSDVDMEDDLQHPFAPGPSQRKSSAKRPRTCVYHPIIVFVFTDFITSPSPPSRRVRISRRSPTPYPAGGSLCSPFLSIPSNYNPCRTTGSDGYD